MGLDLFHVIPAIKTDESFSYFEVAELSDHPEFLSRHADLISEVEVYEDDFDIIVFPDAATRDAVLESNPHYEDMPCIVGDIALSGDQLAAIESEHALTGKTSQALRITDNISDETGFKEIYYDIISYETGPELIKALFYTEKGHQKKGMNEAFYNDYDNGRFYLDKAAVIKAAGYIRGASDKDTEELQAQFKKDFIDSFIEGDSIFFASW